MREIPKEGTPNHPFYIAQCYGKEQFSSVALANKVAKNRKSCKARQVYKCEYCNQWHLGSTPYKRGNTQAKP